jgi:uncharacterized protein (TIGR04255 family)
MPLEKVQRVIYKRNPLDKVTCQLRFPPILKIDSELPANYQERVRDMFPLYSEKVEVVQDFSNRMGQVFAPDVSSSFRKSESQKHHLFSSGDGIWNLILNRTYISLTTSKYTKWEDFKLKLFAPIQALLEIYKPPFFTRIGLRYIDIFDRSKLGLGNSDWGDLLKPYVLGLLYSPIAKDVRSCETKYEITLEDKESVLRIITALVNNIITQERGYLVDSDFYYPKMTALIDYSDKLEFLHEQADRLIKFIITEKLEQALEPSD